MRRAERQASDVPASRAIRTGPPHTHAVSVLTQRVVDAPGQTLDHSTRSLMESRFNHDFSRVRIHADEQAAQSARAMGARAWTSGNQIAFGPGRFSPHTESGRRLLAHELAQVVQQQVPAGSATHRPERIGIAGSAQEREADVAAEQFARGGSPTVRERGVPSTVQRDKDDAAEGAGRKGNVSISVLGECASPRAIAEAIPGARSMLLAAENLLMSYPYLESHQQRFINAVLKAHFGSGSDEVRQTFHRRVMHMSRTMDRAMNAGVTFECGPDVNKKCKDLGTMTGMYITRGKRNVIHVCPSFFGSGLESRRKLLVHESAHLAGVLGKEEYIATFGPIGSAECLKPSPLSGEDAIGNADSYAWAVWCLTREPGITIVPGVEIKAQPQQGK